MPLGRRAFVRVLGLFAVGLLGAVAAAVGVVGLVGWAFAALFAVAPAIEALSGLLPWLVACVVLGVPLAVVGLGGAAATLVGGIVSARERLRRRLGRRVAAYEDELALVGLDDVVDRLDDRSADARAEARVEDLKTAYVEGEIDDAAFERRVEELVDDDDVDPDLVLSLRETVRESESESERERS